MRLEDVAPEQRLEPVECLDGLARVLPSLHSSSTTASVCVRSLKIEERQVDQAALKGREFVDGIVQRDAARGGQGERGLANRTHQARVGAFVGPAACQLAKGDATE